MTNDERIADFAQSVYLARHDELNDATGADLTAFEDQAINWVNQLIPEIEKKADWNFVRTNNDTVGIVTSGTTIAYPLPTTIRKLVVDANRDLTIRQDGTIISTFKVVGPNQLSDPNDMDVRSRVTTLKRQLIFSRSLRDVEVGGTIVADTIAKIPTLSHADVSLLDILDANPDIRQLFVFGVVKNQVLPDIIQGGLTGSFSQKFDRYLQDCITENNASAEAEMANHEDFGFITGVGF